MNKSLLLDILLFFIIPAVALSADQLPQQDPAKVSQTLYNGREWHNLYSYVKGDQFLYTKDYMQASLTIDGKTYSNVNINYDIYNDQLIIPANNGVLIQLNKEMVDSFSVVFQNQVHQFINLPADSIQGIKGYANCLYNGETKLVVKYKKEIDLLAVDDKYDLFFETYRIYILKDGIAYQISKKGDVLKVLKGKEAQVKAFMKKNAVKVSKKAPESFITVLRYYDSLSQ